MAFKLNISNKGKAWKLELESEELLGKKIGDKLQGKEFSADLDGYELEITGASDIAGFPHKKDVEGRELRRVILTKGWGMHKKPKKEGKKPVSTPKGLRLRKTVRGNQISDKTVQINLNVVKSGSKDLKEIFPDQNKEPEKPAEEKLQEATAPADKPEQTPQEAPAQETAPETKETPAEKPVEESKKEEIQEAPAEKPADAQEKKE